MNTKSTSTSVAPNFDEWKRVHAIDGETCTIKTSAALATFLYVEAEGLHLPHQQLAPYDLACTSGNFVSKKGISVDWLLDTLFQLKYFKVLDEFGCELWFIRKLCIPELMRRNNCHGGPMVDHCCQFGAPPTTVVDTATLVVTYSGQLIFSKFVELLEQLRGEYIWIDMMCVDQFSWNTLGLSEDLRMAGSSLMDELKRLIHIVKKTTLLIAKWADTVPTFGRIWVLWEMFCGVLANADFSLVIPNSEKQSYLDHMTKVGFESSPYVCEINSTQASAERMLEQSLIRNKMETICGTHNADRFITERLREWLIQTAQKYLAPMIGLNTWSDSLPLHCFTNVGTLLYDQGRLHEAEVWLTRAADLQKSDSEVSEDSSFSLLLSMANVLRDQGRLLEARPLYDQAVTGLKQVLGSEHPETLSALRNLARLAGERGQLSEAESLYRQVSGSHERLFGRIHPTTLGSLSELAGVLHSQGNFEEADSIYRDVLNGQEHSLGLENVATVTSSFNLANLLQKKGNLDEAEPLYRRALYTGERLFGENHQFTTSSVFGLASVLHERGNLEEAESLYHRALDSQVATLGFLHSDTLTTLSNLGCLLRDQGKLREAEPYYESAVQGYRQLLGSRHRDALRSSRELAALMRQLEASE